MNNKYLSRIYRDGQNSIEAAKSFPDEFCKFKVYVLGKKFSFQADNGMYLSRILYGTSAYSEDNYIEAAKSDADAPSQFTINSAWRLINSKYKVALMSDNGRYWLTRSNNGVNYIKPLSEVPVFYDLIVVI